MSHKKGIKISCPKKGCEGEIIAAYASMGAIGKDGCSFTMFLSLPTGGICSKCNSEVSVKRGSGGEIIVTSPAS